MATTSRPIELSLWTILSRSVQLWVGTFLLLVGIVFSIIGLQEFRQDHAYRTQGLTVNATVVDKSILCATRGENSRTRYSISYRLTSGQDETVEGSTDVPVEEWERVEEGQNLPVTYLPGDAESNRTRGENDWIAALVFLCIGGVFSLIGGGLAFFDLRAGLRAIRVSRHGMATEGTVVHAGPTSTSINRVRQWRIDYRYLDHLGRAHEGASHLLSPEDGANWHEGDKGRVRFDRERPQDSVWIGGPGP